MSARWHSGAALGVVAVLVRQEIVLAIMGGVFVAETLSVAIQVSYFKWSGGKRIFRMAPLHHHYELKGWPEPKIIVRFWIITLILVLIGLSTLEGALMDSTVRPIQSGLPCLLWAWARAVLQPSATCHAKALGWC